MEDDNAVVNFGPMTFRTSIRHSLHWIDDCAVTNKVVQRQDLTSNGGSREPSTFKRQFQDFDGDNTMATKTLVRGCSAIPQRRPFVGSSDEKKNPTI